MPNDATITLKEEGAKFIYRNGHAIACYKQNGVLKFYKLVEVSYSDLSEIYEPQVQ